jgi:hypothetical protein
MPSVTARGNPEVLEPGAKKANKPRFKFQVNFPRGDVYTTVRLRLTAA